MEKERRQRSRDEKREGGRMFTYSASNSHDSYFSQSSEERETFHFKMNDVFPWVKERIQSTVSELARDT